MSSSAARRPRRIVLTLTAALLASVLPTLPVVTPAVAAPVTPAAVLLPAPAVTPTTVVAGTSATVSGNRCKPKGSTRVYVTLTAGSTGNLGSTSSVVPAADGTWTAHVTPPVDSAAMTYTVSATCDTYGSEAAYRSTTLQVTASTAAPWTGRAPALPNVPNGSLADVDCASAVHCVAVGNTSASGSAGPLVETWDGST